MPAQSLHRPIISLFARRSCPTCRCQTPYRPFSQTPRPAKLKQSIQGVDMKVKAQPGIKTALSEQSVVKTNDMGMLPDTFIMPTGPRKPSLFREPRDRLRLEKIRLKYLLTSAGMLLFFRFWLYRKLKPRPKLDYFKVKSEARELYEQMYTAFAEGNNFALHPICADGLLQSLGARISKRHRDERIAWTLYKHLRRPRIVSYRIAELPVPDEKDKVASALLQVIIRMRTRQGIRRWLDTSSSSTESYTAAAYAAAGHPGRENVSRHYAGDGKLGVEESEEVMEEENEEDGLEQQPEEVKDITEYFVIQRRVIRGKAEPWMAWGTTEETTLEVLDARDSKTKEAQIEAVKAGAASTG